MTAQKEPAGWTIQEAERLLLSLQGVVSVRVVARPGGEIEEIHLLTTDSVKPKQTVRNVESALLAHLDLSVDHRKISVAQTAHAEPAQLPEPAMPVHIAPDPTPHQSRLLFFGHQVVTERYNQVKHRVELDWLGNRYEGEATAADLPRAKLEAVAVATLKAVERAVQDTAPERRRDVTLALDGAKLIDAFERQFVLIAVHAIAGRNRTPLAGATDVDESPDRAAILATLQATDRWVRGHVTS